eukprot:scaffold120376_cov21-Tisochrysis_lutea.AAC.2
MFDKVYNTDSKQHQVFDGTALPIVNSCMEGYNGKCHCLQTFRRQSLHAQLIIFIEWLLKFTSSGFATSLTSRVCLAVLACAAVARETEAPVSLHTACRHHLCLWSGAGHSTVGIIGLHH